MAYNDWMKERHSQGLPAPYAEYREIVRQQTIEKARARFANHVPKKQSKDRLFFMTLLSRSKRRAKQNDWSYDLDYDWLMDQMKTGKCSITGIDLVIAGGKNPWQPSIDRIDSSKGYTKNNCQIVCWIYNRAKGDGNHDAVMLMARALVG